MENKTDLDEEWNKEINRRIFDRCPNCGRRKYKRNYLCGGCRQSGRIKRVYNNSLGKLNQIKHCQYRACPNHLKKYEKKDMIKYRRGNEIFYFHSEKCKERFINDKG